jgi:hypothetical protein
MSAIKQVRAMLVLLASLTVGCATRVPGFHDRPPAPVAPSPTPVVVCTETRTCDCWKNDQRVQCVDLR